MRRNQATLLVLVVVLVGLLAVAAYAFVPRSSPAEGGEPVDVVGGPGTVSGVTHTLAGGSVSFQVPEGFGFSVAGEPLLVQHVVPPCDVGYDACVYLSDDAYVGTNFESAGVRISLRDDLGSQDACLHAQPDGYTGLVPTTDVHAGFATSIFSSIGQGAAGHTSVGELRRLYAQDRCYEFETRVAQTEFGNYDPGAIKRFTDGDQAIVEQQLRGVLRSVALPGGEHPWP